MAVKGDQLGEKLVKQYIHKLLQSVSSFVILLIEKYLGGNCIYKPNKCRSHYSLLLLVRNQEYGGTLLGRDETWWKTTNFVVDKYFFDEKAAVGTIQLRNIYPRAIPFRKVAATWQEKRSKSASKVWWEMASHGLDPGLLYTGTLQMGPWLRWECPLRSPPAAMLPGPHLEACDWGTQQEW